MVQFIDNHEFDRMERIRQAKKAAFTNYVNSYIETTQKKRCTCSACKTENAIHPIEIIRASRGVEEVWKCDSCERVVEKVMSYKELSYRLNVDRQLTT